MHGARRNAAPCNVEPDQSALRPTPAITARLGSGLFCPNAAIPWDCRLRYARSGIPSVPEARSDVHCFRMHYWNRRDAARSAA